MTKRDFELIARAINQALGAMHGFDSHTESVRIVADELARELTRVNPRFDAARFMKACGFEGEG